MRKKEYLDMQTTKIVNENIEFIEKKFPNCVTEGPNGKAIDFELLKQELSHAVVEGNKERYRLEWPGKREAIVTANLPTTKTLRPIREDSVDFDNTENLYIEGDNLEVLKLLQESYLGKIKLYGNNKWKAIKFTTLWMPLSSKAESERLVSFFNKRPSWKGINGPHAIRRLIDAAYDLVIEYWMVCANSKKGVSNNIITSGNSFWFKLNHENIDRILKGYPVVNSHFGSFTNLIDWL